VPWHCAEASSVDAPPSPFAEENNGESMAVAMAHWLDQVVERYDAAEKVKPSVITVSPPLTPNASSKLCEFAAEIWRRTAFRLSPLLSIVFESGFSGFTRTYLKGPEPDHGTLLVARWVARAGSEKARAKRTYELGHSEIVIVAAGLPLTGSLLLRRSSMPRPSLRSR